MLAFALAARTAAAVPAAPPTPAVATTAAEGMREPARTLAEVRVVARPEEDDVLPVAVTRLDAATIARSGPLVDASEALARVPGVVANNRWNYAQDLQLSIRGYGARASFGVRGIRLYVNGIPASAADGQGQLAHAALASAGRIEVLRGPLAALYGNAAGGVVRIDSDPRADDSTLRLLGWRGPGLAREAVVLRAVRGPAAGVLDLGRFRTDGFRPHSRARRDTADAHALIDVAPDWQLALAANALDAPLALDPQGLTPAEYAADPAAGSPVARAFNARKAVSQRQVGFALRRQAAAGPELSLAGWNVAREVEQYLALPVAAQASPLSGGGAIELERDSRGLEVRLGHRFDVAPLTLTAGVDVERLDEARRGYENFVGGTLGVRGALRRDERNHVDVRDLLLQAEWHFAERGLAFAGWRRSRLAYVSTDRYVTALNPDDSGTRRYTAGVPAAGVRLRLRRDLGVYAAAARAFEAPTVNELAYRADGSAGLNLALEPSVAVRRELGLRWRTGAGAVELAAFRDRTRDEIVVARALGGRTAFRNAGRTERTGLEFACAFRLDDALDLRATWTALDARFRDRPGTAVAGRRLPGVPPGWGHAELVWRPHGAWLATAALRALGGQYADDANRVRVPRAGLVDLALRHERALGDGTLETTLRVENAFDRRHVAAVIVNEASGRVYEPGPGRRVLLGVAWRW